MKKLRSSEELAKEFRDMRFDVNHHLGLGDLRITQDQQETILQTLRFLETQLRETQKALEEIQTNLNALL